MSHTAQELEAVNIMLTAIPSAVVTTLDGTVADDVTMAMTILSETNKEVQSRGWKFNTEFDVVIEADGGGLIAMPDDVLSAVFSVNSSSDPDPVIRGASFYDTRNKTYVFPGDITASEVVYLRDYDEIPRSALYYIAIKAARRMQSRLQADESRMRSLKDDENDALRTLLQDYAAKENVSMENDPEIANAMNRRP